MTKDMSHPSWVRGLKLLLGDSLCTLILSHPSWVRGLKHVSDTLLDIDKVAPLVGAWIETEVHLGEVLIFQSHPSWVRGLKPDKQGSARNLLSRTPRGCVD